MSVYGWVVCEKCWVILPLGKYLRPADTSPYFSYGSGPNSANSELTRALWKFHADHASHPMRTMRSGDQEWESIPESTMIGGDLPDVDPSFDDYLEGWRG